MAIEGAPHFGFTEQQLAELPTVYRSDLFKGRVDMIDAQKDLADPDEVLLTRVLLALDPGAPLSYKNFTFFPHGWGDLLAIEMPDMHAKAVRA